MAQWVWALLSLRVSKRMPWPPSAPAGDQPTRSLKGSTRWRRRGDSLRRGPGSSSVPHVPSAQASGGVLHSPRDSRLLDYQDARDGAGPGPAPGWLPDWCGRWPDTHPTVCVISFVPGRLSVSGRLLFGANWLETPLTPKQKACIQVLPMVMNQIS